jgi:glycosyltransferase involved in cell wall biosynthesis
MRVLHLAPGFPVSYPGGITNYVRTLGRSQVQAGLGVTVIAGKEVDRSAVAPEIDLIEYESRTIRPFTYAYRRFDPGWGRLKEVVAKARPDVIHVHMTYGLGRPAIRWLAEQPVPYVVSIHDYHFACPRIFMIDYAGETCRTVDLQRCHDCVGLLDQSDILRKVGRVTGKPLPRIASNMVFWRAADMRRLLGNARWVLPVSRRVGEIIQEFCPQASIKVMHIGNASANEGVAKRLAPGVIRAVFIGTLSRIKGAGVLQTLMQGVSRTDMEFHFYGRTDNPARLQALADLGLHNHGPYKPADLGAIMNQAGIGMVLPIWEDNGPQVAMEFINYGTPVLGTRMGGVPDFVSQATGMLFDPFSPEEVAQAISWLNTVTVEDLNELAANIRPLTTPEQHAAGVLEVYRDAVASRPRTSTPETATG